MNYINYYYNNKYKPDDCKKEPELLNNITNAYGEFISAKWLLVLLIINFIKKLMIYKN